MNDKIYSEEEWFKSEPDKLITYLYWLKNQIPNDRIQAKKDIYGQLNKKYPCPEEFKSKWVN